MPLLVPNTSSAGGSNSQQSWFTKLAGKNIGDSHNETTFSKNDLPANHRIVKQGDMLTADHDPNRLTVHVNKDGAVQNVELK